MRAGLPPLETQRTHWGLQPSLKSRHLARNEASGFLQVMANAPTALRAYILADGALVRGKLTLRQRAQVARAETEIKGCAGRLSGQDEAGESFGSTEAELPLARHPTVAALKADRRLGFTQAAVLQRGESSSGYSQVLLKGGFTSGQIAEIIASIALNTFSHYFTHAKPFETVA